MLDDNKKNLILFIPMYSLQLFKMREKEKFLDVLNADSTLLNTDIICRTNTT
jgi:hypothetical protein